MAVCCYFRLSFTADDYVELLRLCPSIQLLHVLVEKRGKVERPLPVGRIITTLIQEDQFDLVLPFIQDLQTVCSKGNYICSSKDIQKLDKGLNKWQTFNSVVFFFFLTGKKNQWSTYMALKRSHMCKILSGLVPCSIYNFSVVNRKFWFWVNWFTRKCY